jgi:hypothetical protein
MTRVSSSRVLRLLGKRKEAASFTELSTKRSDAAVPSPHQVRRRRRGLRHESSQVLCRIKGPGRPLKFLFRYLYTIMMRYYIGLCYLQDQHLGFMTPTSHAARRGPLPQFGYHAYYPDVGFRSNHHNDSSLFSLVSLI